MDAVFLIMGSVVVTAVVTLALKVALRLGALPPQVEIAAFAFILLVCLLTVFGICEP